MIELFVEDDKAIVVTDYTFIDGLPASFDYPPEFASVEDIKCHWKATGQQLTDEEWICYYDSIVNACFEDAVCSAKS